MLGSQNLRNGRKRPISPRQSGFEAEKGATVEILEVKNFDPQKMTISGLVGEF